MSNVTHIKQSPPDQIWITAVDELVYLARKRGLSNMVGATSAAIEKLHKEIFLLNGDEFNDSELCKNLTFCELICELMMNGCDLDHGNANRHDRIAMIDQLIDSLRTMRRRM